MISDSIAGTREKRRDMLLVQCVTQVFYIASSLILKGYSATVQNVVTIARNLVAAKGHTGKALTVFLVLLPVVLGIYFNNRGIIGLLPVAANFQYAVVMFKFQESARALKIALIVNCVMFCIFNFYILNFVSGVACIVISVSTAISLLRTRGAKENEEKEEQEKEL